MSKEKKSSCSGCFIKVFVAILIIVAIGLVVFNLIQRFLIPNNNSKPNLVERVATIHDLEIDESYSFPISIEINVTPKEDIDNLVIKVEYADDELNIIKTKYLSFGNVEMGRTYSQKINITDLGLSEIFSIEKCRFSVYSGTISLI